MLETKISKQLGLEKPVTIKPEVIVPGSRTVHVRELNLSVLIKPGHTIQDWIIRYSKRNAVAKRLFKKYGITDEMVEKVYGSEETYRYK